MAGPLWALQHQLSLPCHVGYLSSKLHRIFQKMLAVVPSLGPLRVCTYTGVCVVSGGDSYAFFI